MRYFSAALLVSVIGLMPDGKASAHSVDLLRTQIVAQGLSLTLTVPRRVYLQNALIKVSVSVQNVSHHRHNFIYPHALCGFDMPGVTVEDMNHKGVYPPAIVPWPGLPCGPARDSLRPGERRTLTGYAILRGPYVQEEIYVDEPSGSHQITSVEVATPIIEVSLVPASAPTITLIKSGKALVALLKRPKGAHGPLLYQSYSLCSLQTQDRAQLNWATAKGSTISSGCNGSITRWSLVAGWLNYPVATMNDVP